MSLRNRAKPATYTLSDSLAELERTDPAVRKAARNLDRATAEIIQSCREHDLANCWECPTGSTYLRERYEALQCALTQPCVVMREMPGELVSTANLRGASRQAAMAKAAGVKAKREMGRMFAASLNPSVREAVLGRGMTDAAPFVVVVLTRIAPRPLDSDNLESALKAVRDGIAEGLGIDDRSPLVRYVVSQEQGGVRVHRVRCELFIQPGALTRNEVEAT